MNLATSRAASVDGPQTVLGTTVPLAALGAVKATDGGIPLKPPAPNFSETSA